MTYDALDRRILAALREDSHRRLLDYTALTGIPKSTVHERLRKLVRQGVRCVPLINWQSAGFPLVACFLVPFREGVADSPCVNTALRLSPNTLFLECVFRSVREAEEFKEQLRTARYFAIVDVLKAEGFIPPP